MNNSKIGIFVQSCAVQSQSGGAGFGHAKHLHLGHGGITAEVMKLRAEVMIRTAQRLKEQFSLDMLLTLASRAGLHLELRL